MDKLAAVAAGGALGAVARWLLAGAVNRGLPGSFAAGTLVVNVLGCLIIGVALALFEGTPRSDRDGLRLLLIVGLLGGFTTWSSFAAETVSLVDTRQAGLAALYVLAMNVLSLAAAWCGLAATRALRGE